MSALTVTLGADITSMKRSLGGAMGLVSSFAKRISGAFSLKGGLIGALAGGSAAALATKLNAAGEAGNTANARIQSVARSMGLFGNEAGVVAKRLSELAEKTELQTGVDRNAIKLTQAKLLTFKELAKSAAAVGGNFDRATNAAIDLAAAGFGSAETNAAQLGKALNNPINPHFPPSGPSHWLLPGPPAESKFQPVSLLSPQPQHIRSWVVAIRLHHRAQPLRVPLQCRQHLRLDA